MKTRHTILIILFASVLAAPACSEPSPTFEEIRRFPITSMEGVLTRSGVSFDETMTSDGNGSIRIVADRPTTVHLYEVEDIDVEKARLIYRAQMRTEGVQGQAYLEMWCRFPGKGEFFSRALDAPLSGTNEWTSQETPFFLRAGQKPDNIKLNLVIDGSGTVWIDDIVLGKGPLP